MGSLALALLITLAFLVLAVVLYKRTYKTPRGKRHRGRPRK
jgi:hypothetical protein